MNTLAGVNATRPIAPLFHRRTPAACTFVCVSIILCVQTDALASAREVESAWKHVNDMLVELIDETRAADESMRTYITDMANRVTGLLQYLRHLLALSTNRVQTLPMRRSPYGGCAYKNYRHTRTL